MENPEEKARKLRKAIVEMVYRAGSGHPGGSLSAIDILIGIYNRLNIDPKNPNKEDRDRFIYSKGHACAALYAVLAEKGFFPRERLWTFRKLCGLPGHSSVKVPGVDFSAGSLGQGLSFANGVALAANLNKKNYKTYVMMGDGEQQEGQVWEAVMTANHYKIPVIAIIDRNGIQNDWFVKETKDIAPLAEKYKSFGWEVIEIDGHNFDEINNALDKAERGDKPVVIIAKTVKGKGVSFMENNPAFHGKAPSEEELKIALGELEDGSD